MSNQSAPLTERRFLAPFVLITSLFFLWAFGVNLKIVSLLDMKRSSSEPKVIPEGAHGAGMLPTVTRAGFASDMRHTGQGSAPRPVV